MQNKNEQLFRLSIFLLTVALFSLPLRAQMTIGNDAAPHRFSLLEIDTTYLNGGLRLPQLTASQCDSLKNEFLKPSATQDYKDAAEGLVVYNVDIGCVEFWIGEDWESSCENSASGDYGAYFLSACDAPEQPGAIDGPQIVAPKVTSSVTYSVANVSGVTYTWTLPVGWTGSSTGNSITVALSDLSQSGTISVTANKDACSSAPSALKVIVGCGAKISATEWKEFMCWNLGADQRANPFEPTAALNGDYYQWGYKYPSATYDVVNGDVKKGTPTTAGGNTYPDPVKWGNTDNLTPGDWTPPSSTDPCPSGYRLPTQAEWAGVINTTLNPKSDKGTSWTDGNWTGSFFGNALFLPAAGYRSYGNEGSLYVRGVNGCYWSSTQISATTAYSVVFANTPTPSISNPTRGSANSVRCIKQ